MFCNSCGKQLPDSAKFCGSCGAKQESSKPIEAPDGGITEPPPRPMPQMDAAMQVKIIYGLSLLGLLTGGLTTIVGVIWAFLTRKEISGFLRTHYDFLVNTFIKSLIATAALLVVLGIMTGVTMLLAMLSPSLTIISTLAMGLISLLGIALGAWVIIRWIKGFLILNSGQPIRNPSAWGLPV